MKNQRSTKRLHRPMVDPLEPRRLFAVNPIDPADAIPFTKIKLDNNTGQHALEKTLCDIATNVAIYFQNSPDSWTTVTGSKYARSGVGVGTLDIGDPRYLVASIGGAGQLTQPVHDFRSNVLDLVGYGPTASPYALYWY